MPFGWHFRTESWITMFSTGTDSSSDAPAARDAAATPRGTSFSRRRTWIASCPRSASHARTSSNGTVGGCLSGLQSGSVSGKSRMSTASCGTTAAAPCMKHGPCSAEAFHSGAPACPLRKSGSFTPGSAPDGQRAQALPGGDRALDRLADEGAIHRGFAAEQEGLELSACAR